MRMYFFHTSNQKDTFGRHTVYGDPTTYTYTSVHCQKRSILSSKQAALM